jgi:hypothetical protein
MTESPDQFITSSTATPEEIAESEAVVIQQKAEQEANAIKQSNEAIYKEIGSLILVKQGKLELGLPTTEEDSAIAQLKLNLQ